MVLHINIITLLRIILSSSHTVAESIFPHHLPYSSSSMMKPYVDNCFNMLHKIEHFLHQFIRVQTNQELGLLYRSHLIPSQIKWYLYYFVSQLLQIVLMDCYVCSPVAIASMNFSCATISRHKHDNRKSGRNKLFLHSLLATV